MVVRRGAAELGAEVPDELVALIVRRAGGDARSALEHPRARVGDRAEPRASRSARRTSRTPRASVRSSTTRAPTRTTTSPRRSSSRCAARIPTRPSTTSRRCSRAARTRASSRAAWSSSPPRTSATPTRAPCSSPSPRRRRSSTSACRRRGSTWRRRRSTSRGRRSRTRATSALGAATRDVREHGNLRPPCPLRDASYGGAQARPRRGLRLPARRSGAVRRRPPAGRAEGPHVLRAIRARRGGRRLSRLHVHEWGDPQAPAVVCLHGDHAGTGRLPPARRRTARCSLPCRRGRPARSRAVGVGAAVGPPDAPRRPRRDGAARSGSRPPRGSGTASADGS